MAKSKYINTVVSKGHVYRYSRPPKGKGSRGVRLPADPAAAASVMAGMLGRSYGHIPLSDYLSHLLTSSRQRARSRKLDHSLGIEDLLRLFLDQRGQCAVAGLPFSMEGDGADPFLRAFAPSIDRKDNAKGYTPGNARLVCRIVNFGMGPWGEAAFVKAAIATAARVGVDSESDAA